MNKRTELNWQPDKLLSTRFGLMDPHEGKSVKPPKYFKHEHQKTETNFEKKETLQQMPGSSMAFDDGDKFFKNIQ